MEHREAGATLGYEYLFMVLRLAGTIKNNERTIVNHLFIFFTLIKISNYLVLAGSNGCAVLDAVPGQNHLDFGRRVGLRLASGTRHSHSSQKDGFYQVGEKKGWNILSDGKKTVILCALCIRGNRVMGNSSPSIMAMTARSKTYFE